MGVRGSGWGWFAGALSAPFLVLTLAFLAGSILPAGRLSGTAEGAAFFGSLGAGLLWGALVPAKPAGRKWALLAAATLLLPLLLAGFWLFILAPLFGLPVIRLL